ncbi:hypothetical protein DPMN_152879 [Dreissena polymorpha]|uniref:Uncharacterized protein n=1 Tax=Dreissena polymorpha TaxID=45954 RepID=A0A9D4FL79_DREPO|nr:hypothetical protein DPMN_152879 [Dreissena polymorpha]
MLHYPQLDEDQVPPPCRMHWLTIMIEEAIWLLGNREKVATWRIPGMSISGATTQQPKKARL